MRYFKKRVKEPKPFLYIGDSYGEITYSGDHKGKKVYIDLSKKSDKEMVNLSLVKQKIEENFVNYKLSPFFQLMYDYEILSESEYNNIMYGTTNIETIKMIKMGLPLHIIYKLETDNQLSNIFIDHNNNISSNNNFEEYRKSLDDFFRFEIDKFL